VTRRRLIVLAALVALCGPAAACGGGEASRPAAPSPPEPAAPAPAQPAQSDQLLTIDEALASTSAEPVRVTGFLLAQEDAAVRLCSALAESYPPQCGGASLLVEGLDLSSVEGLTTPTEPEYAHTSWTDGQIELAGVVANGVLAVSPP
jgi:hypothetical protein